MKWIIQKEKYLSESYYWKSKREVEDESHFVYYDDGEVKYQIHSADRTIGENSEKWVCHYEQQDGIIKDHIDFFEGYMGLKSNEIVFCGGNGMFNAMGLPEMAEYSTIEEAKKICELHNQNPSKVRIYTIEENKEDAKK